MRKIVIATDNAHKLKEIKEILGDKYEIFSKSQVGVTGSPEENEDTLEKNAYIKASDVAQKVPYMVVADDTGIFANALEGKPGVHSARFAYDLGLAKDHDDNKNNEVLLKLLEGRDRSAYFKTAICVIDEEKNIHYVEGVIKGTIADKKRGSAGFGYDSLFIPEGYDKTFGELGEEEKNKISHRARALFNLRDYLEKI